MNLRIINKRSKPPRIILPKASSADAKSEQQDAQKPLELDAGEDVIEKNFYVQSGLAFYRKNGQRSEESSNIDRVKVQWQFEAEQLGASTSSSSRDVEQVMLPGISDSYESYPCPNCSEEKLFMTRAGLEKHASAQHPREFEEISNLANQIQKEWERRKLAKNKATNLQQESEYWKTKAVEMQHQVACHFCDSILSGEAELDLHIASCHYNIPVEQTKIPGNHRLHCHLCWKPCYNIYHLNSHKLSMHGIEAGDATAHHTATTMSQFSIDQNRVVQVASTQCQLCGLIMLRPSLLLRHMVRVHNCHTNFSAKVDYPLVSTDTLPSINYRVDTDGRLVWQCCQQEFKNKETLLAHRASAHPIVEPETVQAERESEILRQLLPRQQNQEHSNSFSMSTMEMGTEEGFLGIDDFSLLAFQSPLLPSNFDTGTMTHHGEDHDLFAGLEE